MVYRKAPSRPAIQVYLYCKENMKTILAISKNSSFKERPKAL